MAMVAIMHEAPCGRTGSPAAAMGSAIGYRRGRRAARRDGPADTDSSSLAHANREVEPVAAAIVAGGGVGRPMLAAAGVGQGSDCWG